MVSSGPKALLMVISPSAAIARTPNKKHIAAINAKVASLVGGLTTLSISLSFRPAGMVEPTNPSCAAAKTIAHKTPLHCGISNPSMSGLGQKRRSQSSPRFLLFPLCPRNRTQIQGLASEAARRLHRRRTRCTVPPAAQVPAIHAARRCSCEVRDPAIWPVEGNSRRCHIATRQFLFGASHGRTRQPPSRIF